MAFEAGYQQRAASFPEEKRMIGEFAASFIEKGDIVFVNSGTTTTQVLLHVRHDPSISIFTNNLSGALEVGDAGFNYYVVGGEFQVLSNSLVGRFAIENLAHVYADKSILGVDGISLKHGCTVPSNAEAEVMRQMIRQTRAGFRRHDHQVGQVSIQLRPSRNRSSITDSAFDPATIDSLSVEFSF
jgi:DeoR family fructose operon transcriptional repressor